MNTKSYSRISVLSRGMILAVAILTAIGCISTQTASDDQTDVFRAVQDSDAAALGELIAAGADVNVPDSEGRYLLGFAAMRGDAEMVWMLLDAGADVNAKPAGDWTALHVATTAGSAQVAKILIAAGADVEAATADEWTALRMAARDGRTDVVAALVDGGARIDSSDSRGRRALSFAAAQGHCAIVELLLENGANPTAPDSGGITPFMTASNFGHVDAARLLCPEGFRYEENGLLLHSQSGARFDSELAGFTRGNPVAFDDVGNNVAVDYLKRIDDTNLMTATVYVYPTQDVEVSQDLLREHFVLCKNDIIAHRDEVHELKVDEFMWEMPSGSRFAFMGMYRLGKGPSEFVSYLFLLGKNKWFIKYRITYPAAVHGADGVVDSAVGLVAAFDYGVIE